ncbi:GNAT family N-acetyltransferase [Aestuariibaculum sediminum]|uniref:GNAT family N-acetyltransferase n=1 Tax=Aestuariibaculum sediminum TaxID=2770637 RepID=A0A8J6QFN1_9FLAO|nr:GNAT family N-acetyltransferase [Aestuariibaculum sediminum]MBD0831264.1 GNAT family N-acetyltransferase [Aestuariibaculum sediminum]
MLSIQVKTFDELNIHELYNILQLRSEVFVVEQNCVYQDVDGKDPRAIHILGFKNNKIVAYARAFKPGDYFEFSSIGRVVVDLNERDFKYGYDIMKASIKAIKTHFNETTIRLSAQVYLKNFYNNLGFVEVGETYLEDDIPHIAMVKE